MDEKSYAFEQVRTKYPLVAEDVRAMADESDTWLIEWEDRTKETSMVGLAYYADHFDDEASVSPV